MADRCTSCGLIEHTDTCPDRPNPPSLAISDELRDALSTIAMAAAQLRDLSFRDTADETREAHNILASTIQRLLERDERMREALTEISNRCPPYVPRGDVDPSDMDKMEFAVMLENQSSAGIGDLAREALSEVQPGEEA